MSLLYWAVFRSPPPVSRTPFAVERPIAANGHVTLGSRLKDPFSIGFLVEEEFAKPRVHLACGAPRWHGRAVQVFDHPKVPGCVLGWRSAGPSWGERCEVHPGHASGQCRDLRASGSRARERGRAPTRPQSTMEARTRGGHQRLLPGQMVPRATETRNRDRSASVIC